MDEESQEFKGIKIMKVLFLELIDCLFSFGSQSEGEGNIKEEENEDAYVSFLPQASFLPHLSSIVKRNPWIR